MTPWTAAGQAPLSMGFSRQEYWGGLPFSPPGDLPDPGIERTPFMSPTCSLTLAPPGKPECTGAKFKGLNSPYHFPRRLFSFGVYSLAFFDFFFFNLERKHFLKTLLKLIMTLLLQCRNF